MQLQPVSYVKNGDTVYANIFSWLIFPKEVGNF